jgi:hypothetical protein
MSLRDRQRAYYYGQLDRLFPGLREKYERAYGERYEAPARNSKALAGQFYSLCEQHGLETQVPQKKDQERPQQLALF